MTDDFWPDPDGLERKAEPDAAELQARAIAKARGERYDPAKHGPFEGGKATQAEAAQNMARLGDIIDRFRTRTGKLRLMARDRPDVRRVAEQ